MYPFAILSTVVSLAALPFSLPLGGILLLTAGLGWILHADYVQRHQQTRLPGLTAAADLAKSRSSTRSEQHPFAA